MTRWVTHDVHATLRREGKEYCNDNKESECVYDISELRNDDNSQICYNRKNQLIVLFIL